MNLGQSFKVIAKGSEKKIKCKKIIQQPFGKKEEKVQKNFMST